MTAEAFDSARFLKTVTSGPGVYRMLDAEGEILYVGKARNLKRRLASYFRASGVAPKTRAMLAQMATVEVTVTHTETEALILENNLIKRHRPRYNILLRDDKSYPFIRLADTLGFPRLTFYRGRRREAGRYFGPYPSTGAVRETLHHLQKLFRLRQCDDTFFKNRSRPCLQYQIQRCSAPCVGLIAADDYRSDVAHAVMFLEGRNAQVIDDLVTRMEAASEALEFERAALLRDQIAHLRTAQERQYVTAGDGECDVVAVKGSNGRACVCVMFIRGGRNLGSKTYFPAGTAQAEDAEVLEAFLPQYYLGREVPHEIFVSSALADAELLERSLAEESGHKVNVRQRVRGERARWLKMAAANAEQALATRLAFDDDVRRRLEALQDALGLEQMPERLECFDISHTGGESTVASCVVFDTNGARRSDYRRFNIEGVEAGDDYAAMRQALERRYTRLKKGEGVLPDILLIDGGKGQLRQAEEVLESLQVEGVTLVGVAKGPTRKPGLEQLFLSATGRPTILPATSPALHLIQQVRDEAHRFAIAGHRQRRAKTRRTSPLEGIAGLGPKRRQQLLRQFGGLQGIARAGVEDLQAVKGISRELARRIYDTFHLEG